MKFKRLSVVLAVLSLAGGAQAQGAAEVASFSPDSFRGHVAFLADDLLEGREAGSRGYDIAARYVATQFEALGLRPGRGDQWMQPVEFVRYSIAGTPSLAIGQSVFTHGREAVVRPTPDQQPLRVEAPLIFVGYGLDLPGEGFDDYAGLDARGKIVVVLNGYPVGTPSDVGAHLTAEKARMAARRGAVGMISIRTRAEEESLPWARLLTYAGRPGTTWLEPDGRPYLSSGLAFSMVIDRPSATALFSGSRRPLGRILREAARRGARPAGFDLGQTARFEREGATSTRFTSPNVIAYLPGSDPALAGEPILLMAHLDGLGMDEPREGEEEGADRIRNGAMDNATGIATLIEVAREMSRPGNRPRRPILFAAVTAEEVGLLGAEYLSRHPVRDGQVTAVVNLDMPILTYNFSDVTAFGAEHSTLGPIVQRAAERMNVRLSPDPLPQEGLFTRSDHYRFVQQGIPSVFLMTGFAGEGRERFNGFLRETYHGPKDDLALPFNWAAGAKFARLNYLIAREIANAPERPLWYADSFFGRSLASASGLAQRPDGQAASR